MTTTNGTHTENGTAQQLLDRLNDPHTANALHKLLDNAELLAFSVSAVDGFIRRGDRISSNVAESVADLKAALPDNTSVYTDQVTRLVKQMPQLIEVAEQLTTITSKPEFNATIDALSKPETLNALNRLLSHIELLTFLLTALDAFVQRGDTLADNVRDSLRDFSSYSFSPDTDLNTLFEKIAAFLPYLPRLISAAPKFIEIIERLEPFVASDEFDALLDSGVFEADTVRLVGQAGDAFVESYETVREHDRKLSPVAAVLALNDPDVQRALALIVSFGRRFGRAIKD
ncbi:MAG: DUF1641 domain-containing protein [Chloroflexi bacterium AL-W]|nr:DUF1641 domain-containing protein [Chloroflexi bacterium AL-W]